MSAVSPPAPTVALLLNLVPDRPSAVLDSLERYPQLASQQDEHGYSLVHAAASYGQLEILRLLVQTYKVDVNIRDEDGQTPLFVVESVDAARCLVEELGVEVEAKDNDGLMAIDFIRQEEDFPDVELYLGTLNGLEALISPSATNGVHAPPALPPNVQINVGTMQELPPASEGAEGVPDPEFRRRIEELAARDDFHGEEGQAQLRELVTDAIRGVSADATLDDRDGTRRRLG